MTDEIFNWAVVVLLFLNLVFLVDGLSGILNRLSRIADELGELKMLEQRKEDDRAANDCY